MSADVVTSTKLFVMRYNITSLAICYWRQNLSIRVCYFSQHGIDATGDRVCKFKCVISDNMGSMLVETEFVNSCVLFQSTWDRC